MTAEADDRLSGRLLRMAGALGARGPDGCGSWSNGRVGLTHTRLAIIDIAGGAQPLSSSRGGVIVANGEIYNDLPLRAQLGGRFATGSDCETPLHLYEQDGLGFASRLRGMFALAIYDPAEDRLVLARDPFGIKPLYYVAAPWGFAFASEPRALIAARLADPGQIDPVARAELFQLQFLTGERTLHAEIRRVLPGETLVVKAGRIVSRQRERVLREAPRPKPSATLQTLEEQLEDTVAHHLRSEAPSGLFLSGGVDSAVLLRLMSRTYSGPVETLTASFPGSAKDETARAAYLARAVGARQTTVPITAEAFVRHAPALVAALDDPTTDIAAFPLFMLGRAAAERGLKVMLSGEGADELLGGYKRYRRAAAPFALGWPSPKRRTVFRGLDAGRPCLSGWEAGIADTERDRDPSWSRLQAMQSADCEAWLPNDLLLKLDRCLMTHGVEGRTPFVDRVFSTYAHALPDRAKVDARHGKLILRRWLAEHFPDADAYAPKQGFISPMGDWLATFGARVEPLVLASPAFEGLVMDDVIRRAFARPRELTQVAWTFLFYALWFAIHALGVSSDGDIEAVLREAAPARIAA